MDTHLSTYMFTFVSWTIFWLTEDSDRCNTFLEDRLSKNTSFGTIHTMEIVILPAVDDHTGVGYLLMGDILCAVGAISFVDPDSHVITPSAVMNPFTAVRQ
jgi:hypothetical protein